MIILRDVLVRPGIIDSARVCALPLAAQLFFRNLLHACDGAGRFPADADELRSAFYWRSPGVSRPHLESWLHRLHQDRLVKLYTRGSKPYGEICNYGQRDTKRRVLYPPPDEAEPELFTPAPPPDPEKRSEVKGRKRATPAPDDSQESWIAGLRTQWPEVDVLAELLRAERHKRLKGQALERSWFETEWLPKCSPTVVFNTGTAKAPTAVAEPEAWRLYLKDEYEGESWAESAAACAWGSLPKNWQERISREMGGRKHANRLG